MHSSFETLCTALLTTFVSLSAIACDTPDSDVQATPDERAAVIAPESAPAEAAPAPAPVDLEIEDAPVLASAVAPIATPRPTPRPRAPESLRSPSLLSADTPELNIAAFTELPIAKRDKAPIAGAGASGIHLDELELGKGWASSRCEGLDRRFVVDVDERVNLCFRVVHPRENEHVTVEWARAGKVRQTIDVSVRPTHAYLTRAWLPVSAGRAGEWSATVKSEDGTVLGQIEFEIAK